MLEVFSGKRVFLTGHTGFKGSWLSKILLDAGAEVCGYSLEPPTEPNLFNLLALDKRMESHIGDVRDFDAMHVVFDAFSPQYVMHLAAQPLVRESYVEPRYTYETNVMGTVNILECVRASDTVSSFLNVTTDKVYLNREREEGYREDEFLDGYDPYSNSKSCSELVTHSYRNSFFSDSGVSISTARAGNVIGGGDFAADRIIPDCVRAARAGLPLIVRNPHSTRPYQHVLEPLFAYLMIVKRQEEDAALAGWYNVGPDDCDCVDTGALATLFCDSWNKAAGSDDLSWINKTDGGPHEANYLKLDCTKIKNSFGWKPRWHIEDAIDKTVQWSRAWLSGDDIDACMTCQIEAYLQDND